jgi:cell division protein FtsL
VLALSTVLVFGVMLLAAAVHTTIVSGQRQLDRVDQRIADTSRQNQSLRLEVAELESPARIVEAATEDGMVVPEDVTWLAPQADEASDPAATDTVGPGATDERADEGAGQDDPGGSDR